jgi:hypothetical protein
VVVVVVLVVQWGGLGAQRGLRYDPKRRRSSKKKVQGGNLGNQGGRFNPMTLYILVSIVDTQPTLASEGN